MLVVVQVSRIVAVPMATVEVAFVAVAVGGSRNGDCSSSGDCL